MVAFVNGNRFHFYSWHHASRRSQGPNFNTTFKPCGTYCRKSPLTGALLAIIFLMNSIFDSVFSLITDPFKKAMDLRYMRLRETWKQYCREHDGKFSEHSFLNTMYLQTEAEHEQARRKSSAHGESSPKDPMQSLLARNPLIMPVARMTIQYRGFTIRIQSQMEWPGGVLCIARVHLAAIHELYFLAKPKENRIVQALSKSIEFLGAPAESTRKAAESECADITAVLNKMPTKTLSSGNPWLDQRYEFESTQNLAELVTGDEFRMHLLQGARDAQLRIIGNPDRRADANMNDVVIQFTTDIYETSSLDATVHVLRRCIDSLADKKLADPVDRS